MKRSIVLGIISLLLLACKTTKIDEDKYYAVTETVFIDSKVFGKKRELQIFLPTEYFTEPSRKFKVLYLFDAQNQRIFNFVKGNIELLSMNDIEPLIIIGVVTEDRWNEFLTLNNYKETLLKYEPPMGNAALLLKHIESEIEPFVKNKYRTENYRIAIGQSLGATFISYVNFESDQLFDYNILISPNYAYDKEQFVNEFKKFVKKDLSKERKFFFCNSYGDDYEKRFDLPLQKIIKIITDNKNPNISFKYEKLSVKGHGNTWYEAVYKGLMNCEFVKK